MTLEKLLNKAKKYNANVRVFAGWMTIFQGKPSETTITESEKLRPYLDCEVFNYRVINGIVVIAI